MKTNRPILKRPLTAREYKLIPIFIICLIFYGLYFILIPGVIKLNTLKEQLQTITNKRSAYRELYEKPIDYKEALTGYNDIVKKVPTDKNLSEFIIDVEKWAKAKDVTVISICPQNTVAENVAGTTADVIPCEITINGDFDSLLNFLSELENYSRLSRIDSIELNAPTYVMAKATSMWKLVVKISLYYLTV